MQKLKVYLSKQNKTTTQKLRLSVLKNRHPIISQSEHYSNNNHNTSLTQLPREHIVKNYTQSHPKRRNNSNLLANSQQKITDFRAEIRQIIRKPYRYDNSVEIVKKENREEREKQKDKYKAENKKNSKQIASDTRLNYRTTNPYHSTNQHTDPDRNTRKSHKSEKSLDNFIFKGTKFNQKQNIKEISLQLKEIDLKPKIRAQISNKNSIPEKVPTKKRSKSAHPNIIKENQQQIKQPNRKRSRSSKKVNKSVQKNRTQISEQTKVIFSSNRQIEMRSMFRTRKGVQITNPNKVNQDRFFIKENIQISSGKPINVYAVADGHGPFGHCVSHLIVENFHKKLLGHLKQTKNTQGSLEKVFNQIQHLLHKTTQFNAQYSGSTLVSLVIENNKRVVCANVGDSRAIVARQLSKTNWEIIRLSNDHKPGLQEEKARILAQGGRIETVYDQMGRSVGPLRVWLPKKQLQGLAMSRSLGDNISKPIGVTHEPQILIHDLSKEDKFILIASDGVWQFLSNYQILNIIIPYYRQNRLEDACQALMKEAYRSWTVEDNSIVDDITFILIFLYSDNKSGKTEKLTENPVSQSNSTKIEKTKDFESDNNKESQKQLQSKNQEHDQTKMETNINREQN